MHLLIIVPSSIITFIMKKLAFNLKILTYLAYNATYTAGCGDYKYDNKFYANIACTGTYSQQYSYEHFTVY